MRNILTIVFALLISTVNGQSKELKRYYTVVSTAENYLLGGMYDSSLACYKEAFEIKKNPFARHVFIATLVAAKLRDYGMMQQTLTGLIALGMPLKKLQSVAGFNDFFLNSKEGGYLVKNAKKIKPLYHQSYRKAIFKLLQKDQFFRKKEQAYTKYADTIQKIDKLNVASFNLLIKKHGFPTEQKIGIDSSFSFEPIYSAIILHQSNGKLQQYDFSELIRQNVINGNLENRSGYFLFSRTSGFQFPDFLRVQQVKLIDSLKSKGNPDNHIVVNTSPWGVLPINKKDEERYNIMRDQFMLDKYSVMIKKSIFAVKNDNYIMMESSSSKSTLLTFDEKSYNEQKSVLSFFE